MASSCRSEAALSGAARLVPWQFLSSSVALGLLRWSSLHAFAQAQDQAGLELYPKDSIQEVGIQKIKMPELSYFRRSEC